jgi:hypothetical protein
MRDGDTMWMRLKAQAATAPEASSWDGVSPVAADRSSNVGSTRIRTGVGTVMARRRDRSSNAASAASIR